VLAARLAVKVRARTLGPESRSPGTCAVRPSRTWQHPPAGFVGLVPSEGGED
jgi:hypothetical protein